VRALAYLGVLAVHVDKVCAARYPDTYGDSRFRASAAHGDLWKAPFRILTHSEDYFMGVFLVVSGFLAAFVLFLRSGPLMQQVVASLFGLLSLSFSRLGSAASHTCSNVIQPLRAAPRCTRPSRSG
jgi:hypothetical protein